MGNRRVLAAAGLYHLANDASISALPALFPILREPLGFGDFEIGLLTGTSLVVTIACQLLFGALSDRVGSKVLLPAGIGWLGLSLLLIATSTTYGALFLFVALARVGASAYHPTGIAWVSREFRGSSVDKGMGVQSSFGDAGVLLGLFPAGFLALLWGWPGVFVFWGAVNLVAAVAGFAVTAKVPEPRQPAGPLLPPGLLRALAPWLVPLVAGGGVFWMALTFGPILLTDQYGLPPAWAAALVGVWIGIGVLAALAFGRITRRFGRVRVLTYAYLAIAVGGVMLANGSLMTVVLGLVAFLPALFLTYPALFAMVSDIADVRAQGLAYGVIFGFQLTGGSLGSYAAGAIAETTHPGNVFYLLAGLALSSFVYLVALREVRKARGPSEAPGSAE